MVLDQIWRNTKICVSCVRNTDSEDSGFLGQLLPFIESETCEYNETSESQNKTVWSMLPLLQEVNVASGQMLHLLQEVMKAPPLWTGCLLKHKQLQVR